jgi:hypothetical protein
LSGCFGQSNFEGSETLGGGQVEVPPPTTYTPYTPSSEQCGAMEIKHSTLRKLSNTELTLSLQDLLGTSARINADLPPDALGPEGFTNNGDFLTASPDYAARVMVAVEQALSAAVTEKTAALTCPSGTEGSACAQALLTAFLKRAYRQTVPAEDVARYVSLFDQQRAAEVSFDDALSSAYAAALLSPDFLYRTATSGTAVKEGLVRLSPQELATRLAYFLWTSLPDDRLIDLAEQGTLLDEQVLREEVTRMLKDPRAKRFSDLFVGQWLGIDKILSTVVVSRVDLTPELRQDIVTETKKFTEHVFREGKSVQDLVGADYTFINQRLAELYGISGVTGEEFQQVSLSSTARRGLIAQSAFLTLSAKPDDSAPVGRGNRVLKVINCTPPGDPDPKLLAEEMEKPVDPNSTVRERFEAHRTQPACAGCHAEMDPIGFGLENYDQLGRYRTLYPNGREIDPTGTLRGTPFKDSAGLIEIINQQNDFKRCIAKNVMIYAVGRSLTYDDNCVLEEIGKLSVQKDKTFVDLVVAIVKSDAFQLNTFE